MSRLTEIKCVPCHSGEPHLTLAQLDELKAEVLEWQVAEHDGIPHLQCVFRFKDFLAALEFSNHVGELAEAEDHHPLVITEWGCVTVQWWTHKINGLHHNNFIMAAKTDLLYPAH